MGSRFCLYFYAYSRKHLESSLLFFYNFFNYYFFDFLGAVAVGKTHRMPVRRKVFALLRSPHVNKKSMEHLGIYRYCSFLYIPQVEGKAFRLLFKFLTYFILFFSIRLVVIQNYNWFFHLNNNELH